MRKKILWITETAVLLALLIAGQWMTRGLGQLVTGSVVNAILALSVLLTGLSGGFVVAVFSPLLATLLGIAPQWITVPAIMVGNSAFVLCLHVFFGEKVWKRVTAWLLAAAVKFAVLYLLVVQLLCGVASGFFVEQGLLNGAMLQKLPGMFSIPQLFTALIGGALALLLQPILKKALRRA